MEATEDSTLTTLEKPSSLLSKIGWILFGVFLFILFTLVKLPQDRIKSYVQNQIAAALAPRGIGFEAAEGGLSFSFGGSYVLSGISLTFPNLDTPITVEKIAVAPSFLALVQGRMGGKVLIENHGGSLRGTASVKGEDIALNFSFDHFDLGKLGLLQIAAGVKTSSGIVDGSVNISGNLSNAASLDGDIDLDLKKVIIDAQNIMGFSVPQISISDSKLAASISGGKAQLKTIRLGKPGSPDDIQATVTGDIGLQNHLENSNLNLKTRFSLSQTILKSFVLIDALLGPGKQPDGSYAFILTGPMNAAISTPGI